MKLRGAFSLIETVLVVAIVSVLLALVFPAVQKARELSKRSVCQNNLRQIGLAATMYHDGEGVFPAVRLCPAPWKDGADPECKTLPSPDTYTGPNEVWWAPYDNRPGTDPTTALPDYTPKGLIWKYVEGNQSIFRCPHGFDDTLNSPTFGKRFQVSYALNTATAGKKSAELSTVSGTMLAWDHSDLPGCAYRQTKSHWTMWPANLSEVATRHRPYQRHSNAFNMLYCDGHVVSWAER